ncbi:MAG: hypothetical protein IJA90_11530 [Peptococcaceae bacterium]|nr:hypothetical protein [Peptococcaceae bacterium]
MKTITITLEQEKYEALNFYLKKSEKDAQKELEGALNKLYEETVPQEAREYIDFKAKNRLQAKEQSSKERKNNRKTAVEKAAEQAEKPVEDKKSEQLDGTKLEQNKAAAGVK